MTSDLQTTLLNLAVAALGGLAVGVEREWSARRPGEPARFGGVRTFLLLGLTGGLAAVLFRLVDPRLGLVLFAAGLGLLLVSYQVSARGGNIDATSEVAGLLVLGAGAAAGFGLLIVASAVSAATALVLVEKGRMHAAVARLESSGLEAGARFAVLALVVLPALPQGPIARLGGLEPQKLWGIVLIFAGLSFAGYIALRLAGPERGYAIAGFLGGLVSSTAVTLNFARESRRDSGDANVSKALALGVVAACAMLPLRVGVVAALLAAPVARALVPALILPLAASAVVVGFTWFRRPQRLRHAHACRTTRCGSGPRSRWLSSSRSSSGCSPRCASGSERAACTASSAVLGLTDMDALTFSLTQLAGRAAPPGSSEGALTAEAAARGLVVGMLANTIFKGAVATVVGAGAFRLRVAAALAVLAALFALGLLWI